MPVSIIFIISKLFETKTCIRRSNAWDGFSSHVYYMIRGFMTLWESCFKSKWCVNFKMELRFSIRPSHTIILYCLIVVLFFCTLSFYCVVGCNNVQWVKILSHVTLWEGYVISWYLGFFFPVYISEPGYMWSYRLDLELSSMTIYECFRWVVLFYTHSLMLWG